MLSCFGFDGHGRILEAAYLYLMVFFLSAAIVASNGVEKSVAKALRMSILTSAGSFFFFFSPTFPSLPLCSLPLSPPWITVPGCSRR